MRLNESIVISAPPKLIWDYLADPSQLPALHVRGHPLGGQGRAAIGLGARYRMLMRVGAAEAAA